ncbi:MAG TPA: hypothetical protein ENN78_01240 [Candidatus Omnitrophica bacterium]|nr:hypothetical protein [Candidatus Omnitrophota bacterium]
MWRRLTISDDMKSTNIIVLLDEETSNLMVPFIEDMVYQFEGDGFDLRVSGMPYIVELIRRSLIRDISEHLSHV